MILLALAEVVTSEVPAIITEPDNVNNIVGILSTVGDIGAIGLSALALFLIFFAMKNDMFKKKANTPDADIKNGFDESISNEVTAVAQNSDLEEIKPILKSLVKSIEKMSGNDLSHIQSAIDALGINVARIENKVNTLEDKIETHDKQARDILYEVKSSRECVSELKQKLDEFLMTKTASK